MLAEPFEGGVFDDGFVQGGHAGIALRQLGCLSEDCFRLKWILDVHQVGHPAQQPECLIHFSLALSFRCLIDDQHRLLRGHHFAID